MNLLPTPLPASHSPETARILLVDPVEASRNALARRLASIGFLVETAADGVEGAAAALGNPPAVIIADLWMPGVSGIQLCRLLRSEVATLGVPVLLRGEEENRRNRFWAERAGAFALLGKGRMGELVRVLRRAIDNAPARYDFFLQLAGTADVRDRIARHLDAALFESVIAAEIRALASSDSTAHLFDLLSQLLSQIHCYRWLALRAPASGFLGLHHREGEGEQALAEARSALGAGDDEAFLLEDEDPAGGAPEGPPVVRAVTFGGRELGVLALGPRAEDADEAAALATSVARELGGALRMTTLVEETQRLAATDALTGLANRRSFLDWAGRELARIERHGGGIAMAILDVDHFKSVNDRHGHGAGDRVLRTVARTVRDELRTSDLAARWGGEELVLALPGGTIEGGLVAAERVRAAIAAATTPLDGGPALAVTASIGVALRHPGESLEALLERADAAMYVAKKGGRNRVVAADPPAPAPAPEVARRFTSATGLSAVSVVPSC